MLFSNTVTAVVALAFASPILASPPLVARADLPQPTLSGGLPNPFYPCGLDAASCPYRCYVLPSATLNSTVNGLSKLQDQCYTKAQAQEFIDQTDADNARHACVKCVTPNPAEVPKANDTTLKCQPVSTYFGASASTGEKALQEFNRAPVPINKFRKVATPARCGTRADPIAQCAWVCAEAQTPFHVCDSKNSTGEFATCDKCVPQCSSPVTIGGSAMSGSGPNLSNQSACPTGAAAVECPWICTQNGRNTSNNKESFKFCSVVDKSDGMFTTCASCT